MSTFSSSYFCIDVGGLIAGASFAIDGSITHTLFSTGYSPGRLRMPRAS
jgi:hypothetical protein